MRFKFVNSILTQYFLSEPIFVFPVSTYNLFSFPALVEYKLLKYWEDKGCFTFPFVLFMCGVRCSTNMIQCALIEFVIE